MTVRVSTSVRNATVDAARGLIDAGSGAGKLRIYTGAQPATPATAATGTLLVEIALNDPATDTAASGGSASLDVSPAVSGVAVASGTAGYARLLDSNNNALIDAAIPADLSIDNSSIVLGGTVSVSSLAIAQPAS
jgi:hypothetical protein